MQLKTQTLKNPLLFIGLLLSLSFMMISCEKDYEDVNPQAFSQNDGTALDVDYTAAQTGDGYTINAEAEIAGKNGNKEEIVVVANRGSGSVSFIDAESEQVLGTLSIPGSQPMYVVYVEAMDRIYVGDRAQNKVHVINPDTKAVMAAIDVGNGVFHMWADGNGDRLWVNNDIDETTSVIDLHTNTVVHTIDIGAKPHDVFVTEDGSRAYVSVINPGSDPDEVFMYSATTFQKTGEQVVGKDPHLFHLWKKKKLYVPCQSGDVYALDESDLGVINVNAYPGAHGIFATANQNTIFVTNISGAELYAINTIKDEQIGSPTGTAPIPHNLVVNKHNSKLFVTHSGATANTLSIYTIDPQQDLMLSSTLTIGTNPFGLAYYERKNK